MRKIVWIALIITGCTLGPKYQAPENAVSDAWIESPHIVLEVPATEWWTQFNDDTLTKYINLAAENNKDVLTAASNILQARAFRKISASSFYPQIGADVNATRTYFSKNGPVFSIGQSTGDPTDTSSTTTGLPFALQTPQTQNLYNLLFDASWEIDFFGKTRKKVEAANALIGKSIEEHNDVLLTIMAELAYNYMELRSAQKRSELIQENITFLEQKAWLIKRQFQAGYVSRLDDENITAELLNERAKLPDVLAKIHRNAYAIAVLTGNTPDALLEELLIVKPLPLIPQQVFVGLKSDVLRRRPDVRAAERTLAAATANIGVAVAEFFPSVKLLADGGLQSLLLKNLFSLGSKTWAFGGDISLPLFEGGRLKGNLEAKKAETAAAGFSYQQIVLKALEEAEGALITYTEDLKKVRDQTSRAGHYCQITFLSYARNAVGLDSFLNVLDTKQQYIDAELAALDSKTQALLDCIRLYKVLGGPH